MLVSLNSLEQSSPLDLAFGIELNLGPFLHMISEVRSIPIFGLPNVAARCYVVHARDVQS